MIRAGKLVLAFFLTLGVLSAERAFAQTEGPGGIVYGEPAVNPPAYVADPCEESWIDVGAAQERLASPFEAWSFRAEYLNWTISDPGNALLGSNILGNDNPRIPFIATDTQGTVLGTAIVPSTTDLKLRANNGLKLTMGTDLTMGGRLEVNGFMLAKATSSYTLFGELNAQRNQPYNLIATSTDVNGQLANNLLFYNDKFSAFYQSNFWGTGAEYLFDVDREGFFWFQPLVGVRYFSLSERLSQVGVFTDTTFFPPPSLVSTIDSKTWNSIAGAEVGFRAELKTRWFSFGVDPKMGLAANVQRGTVTSNNFRAEQDPLTSSSERYVGSTLFFDLGTWAEMHVSQNFSLRAGYNLLWLGRVTRPENNIIYNDNGAFPTPPDIHVHLTRHSVVVDGLTLGAEFKW